MLGFVIGIIALPVSTAVRCRLTLRDFCGGWFVLTLVCGLAWIGAFSILYRG